MKQAQSIKHSGWQSYVKADSLYFKAISKHKNPRDIYAAKLLQENVISTSVVKELEDAYKAKLDENLEESRKKSLTVISPFMQNEWTGFEQVSDDVMLSKFDTKFDKQQLTDIASTITELPKDYSYILHPSLIGFFAWRLMETINFEYGNKNREYASGNKATEGRRYL